MLTAREAADRLGSSYHTIRKWITDGKITYGKHGKSIRFREWDFDALVTDGLRGENVMNNIKLAPFRAIRAFARTVISNPPPEVRLCPAKQILNLKDEARKTFRNEHPTLAMYLQHSAGMKHAVDVANGWFLASFHRIRSWSSLASLGLSRH